MFSSIKSSCRKIAVLSFILFLLPIYTAFAHNAPFQDGEIFVLTNGYNSPPTHIKKDAYALDFSQSKCDAFHKEVLSTDDGKVVKLNSTDEWGYGYGFNVIIEDKDGIQSRYAHLDKVLIGGDDVIKTGDVIGLIGNTGFYITSASKPSCEEHPGTHLHFVMYESTKDMNGKELISAYKPEPMESCSDVSNKENVITPCENFTALHWYKADTSLVKQQENDKKIQIPFGSGDNETGIFAWFKNAIYDIADTFAQILPMGSFGANVASTMDMPDEDFTFEGTVTEGASPQEKTEESEPKLSLNEQPEEIEQPIEETVEPAPPSEPVVEMPVIIEEEISVAPPEEEQIENVGGAPEENNEITPEQMTPQEYADSFGPYGPPGPGGASNITAFAVRPENNAVPVLECAIGKWLAGYFSETTSLEPFPGKPTVEQCEDAPLVKDWSIASPAEGVSADNFSARWTGIFDFPEGGVYIFGVSSDDGMRIYIDDEPWFDRWYDTRPTFWEIERTLTAGEHKIVVEYYEHEIEASAKVAWYAAGSDEIALWRSLGSGPPIFYNLKQLLSER